MTALQSNEKGGESPSVNLKGGTAWKKFSVVPGWLRRAGGAERNEGKEMSFRMWWFCKKIDFWHCCYRLRCFFVGHEFLTCEADDLAICKYCLKDMPKECLNDLS